MWPWSSCSGLLDSATNRDPRWSLPAVRLRLAPGLSGVVAFKRGLPGSSHGLLSDYQGAAPGSQFSRTRIWGHRVLSRPLRRPGIRPRTSQRSLEDHCGAGNYAGYRRARHHTRMIHAVAISADGWTTSQAPDVAADVLGHARRAQSSPPRAISTCGRLAQLCVERPDTVACRAGHHRRQPFKRSLARCIPLRLKTTHGIRIPKPCRSMEPAGCCGRSRKPQLNRISSTFEHRPDRCQRLHSSPRSKSGSSTSKSATTQELILVPTAALGGTGC